MGLPWPPAWEEGGACGRCAAALFDNSTPAFVYAQCVDIVLCAGFPPVFPDPNRVIRMVQSIPDQCFWEGGFREGVWDYSYGLTFHIGGSSMRVRDISGMWIFREDSAVQCIDIFANQLVCGPPLFPGFSGGTVHCFW